MRSPTSYQVANVCGVVYTAGVIAFVAAAVLYYVCPVTYGEGQCGSENMLGAFILGELFINFFYFLKYSWLVLNFPLKFREESVYLRFRIQVLTEICFFSNDTILCHDRIHFRQNDPQSWSTHAIVDAGVDSSETVGKFCIECNRMAPKRSHHCPLW